MLNAPVVRATAAGPVGGTFNNPLRGQSYEPQAFGLNQLRPGMPSGVQPHSNALRPAAPETASPVQPAGYTARIRDDAGSGR